MATSSSLLVSVGWYCIVQLHCKYFFFTCCHSVYHLYYSISIRGAIVFPAVSLHLMVEESICVRESLRAFQRQCRAHLV